jgi:hypothetical protein
MAGFEVTLYGRIWVTPKESYIPNIQSLSQKLLKASHVRTCHCIPYGVPA